MLKIEQNKSLFYGMKLGPQSPLFHLTSTTAKYIQITFITHLSNI